MLLGYVAGVIDGEGAIMSYPHFEASVSTTTKSLAERLRDVAGGSVAGPYLYERRKRFGNRLCRLKPQCHWNFSSRYNLYLLLLDLEPYLVVKQRIARELIAKLEKRYGWRER